MAPTHNELRKAVDFWKRSALDNLKTAEAMLKSKRYNFTMFMCHQTLEAALKALYIASKKSRPPYIHKLPKLLGEIGLLPPLDIDQTILKVDAHYIKARYFEDRFNTKVYNEKNTRELISLTKEALQWLLNQIR